MSSSALKLVCHITIKVFVSFCLISSKTEGTKKPVNSVISAYIFRTTSNQNSFPPINTYLAAYPRDLRTMCTDHTAEWSLLLLLFGIVSGYARCRKAPKVRALIRVSAGGLHQGIWQ